MNRSLPLALLAFAACHAARTPDVAPAPEPAPAPAAKLPVEFYVMSLCPYGLEAEEALGPTFESLGDAIDLQVHFLGDALDDGTLRSMHGDAEIEADLLQVCAARRTPKGAPRLLACMARTADTIPLNFDACAAEAGIDAAAARQCATGDEGRKLLAESFRHADARGVRGSPSVVIGDEPYDGPRTGPSFLRALCPKFGAARPAACAGVPDPVRIPVAVLLDARCPQCTEMAGEAMAQLKGVFPGLDIRAVDYATEEGRKLYEPLKGGEFRFLPALFFGADVEKDPSHAELAPYFLPVGEWRLLKTDGQFDPTAEICGNDADDDGNGATDCKDAACAKSLGCRKPTPGTLDLWVMSGCPFGIRAGNAMKEVLASFGTSMKFRLRFVVSPDGQGGLRSLHGPGEVEEDLRQACAQKHYAGKRKFLEYVWCRNAEPGGDWKACAKGGIDARVIEKCATGPEGRKLLQADADEGEALGVDASPTWVVNGTAGFSALAPEEIRLGFCAGNGNVKACAKTLSSDAGGAPEGGCRQ